jgi:hypothetical protein
MAKPVDLREPRRLEDAFATPAGGPLVPHMRPDDVIVAERTLFGEVVTAQKVQQPRDEAKILQRIKTMAAAAGEAWYYRFPVKKKGGGVDYIEGPSIDCTDAVARYYGNCRVDTAVVDQGPTWMIYSRFIDLETGYTLVRPFQQDKAGATLGGDDLARKLAIALAIGTSKSQRNVVDHALRDFTTFAFEEAQKNIVERIGKRMEEYRQRAVERLNALGQDMVARCELAYGRKVGEWLAPDLARIIAELRAIADGMASPDEAWPRPAPPEPRRSDVTDVPDAPEVPPAGEVSPPPAAAAAAPASPAQPVEEAHPTGTEPPPKDWSIGDDAVGQDAVLQRLHAMLARTETLHDVDDLEADNAARIAKITGNKRAAWNMAVRDRRTMLGAK